MPYSIKRWGAEIARQKQNACKQKWRDKNHEQERKQGRIYAHEHKEERKNYYLQKLCGLTIEQYRQERERVKGQCGICFKEKPLVVDHDHKTKRFRGLLCRKCNIGIGMLLDNPVYVANALRYLNDH